MFEEEENILIFNNLNLKTTMKNLIYTALLICFTTTAFAQQLTQNETTKRWEYIQVFDMPNTKVDEIYKRILTNYVTQTEVIQSQIENEKIVLSYQIRLGTFKYARVTETYDIKEGKIRWRLNNIVYLKATTALSKYKELDNTSDKSIIKKINNLVPDWIKDINDKIVNTPSEDQDKW